MQDVNQSETTMDYAKYVGVLAAAVASITEETVFSVEQVDALDVLTDASLFGNLPEDRVKEMAGDNGDAVMALTNTFEMWITNLAVFKESDWDQGPPKEILTKDFNYYWIQPGSVPHNGWKAYQAQLNLEKANIEVETTEQPKQPKYRMNPDEAIPGLISDLQAVIELGGFKKVFTEIEADYGYTPVILSMMQVIEGLEQLDADNTLDGKITSFINNGALLSSGRNVPALDEVLDYLDEKTSEE